MEFISSRIKRISVSQTLEMAKRSTELKEKGIDIIDLSIGQPDFPTPEHIKRAAIEAIERNYTFYTPVAGYSKLRGAIVDKLKRENNLDYHKKQIVVSSGAKQALANTLLTLIDEGDEIIVPTPYWVSYAEIDNLAHGKNVFIKTTIKNDYKITAEQLENAITPKTRALLYSSPSNPSGSVYSYKELEALAKVIEKHPKVHVVSDEIYEHINYVGKHESIAQFDFIKDRVIVINGMSKGYAMTGWRLGYMAAPQWIADLSIKLQGQYTSCASSISQRAAYAALTKDNVYTLGMNAAFQKRRDLIVKSLKEIPGLIANVPQGAFYAFPDVSSYYGRSDTYISIKNSSDLSMYLLNEAHVATVPGIAFGNPECIRFSYAASTSNIIEAMKRVKVALGRIR
ncbi:MAG: pyridoxal phosphate-dependent aminotransferase [Bacteroidota bacterium]|nr:pyridoxal phosphate-dependent aminotransferase [Bacteroidota bacterium]